MLIIFLGFITFMLHQVYSFQSHSVLLYILQNGNTALIFAASKWHTNILKELISKGANVNLQNEVSNKTSTVKVIKHAGTRK